jgi:streptogramin lyase
VIGGARARTVATSAAARVVLLSAAAWWTACNYPQDWYPPSAGAGDSGEINASDGGEDGEASASGGGSSGSTSSSGSSSGGVVVVSGDGGVVVGSDVPGPKVTFTDFAVMPDTAANIPAPGAICTGPDGRIWFLHQSTNPNAVGAVTVNGQNFGQVNNTTTNIGPVGINPGPDGNVWYTKQQGFGKITPSTLSSNGNVIISNGWQEYGSPMGAETGGIVQGPDGNLWFTGTAPAIIGKSTTSGQSTSYALSGMNRTPIGITAGPDGNLWYTDTSANIIGRITTSGTITEFMIPTASSYPAAICAGPKGDGNVWFVEHDAHNIGRITPSGTITEFAIASGAQPSAIAAGPDGNLWFTEPGPFNAVGRCTPSGGISEYPLPSANAEPAGITAGPDGNMWFSEEFVGKIGRLSDLTGGGTLASSTITQTPLGGTATMCTKDTDCVNGGMGCGGDVCSHLASPPTCVLANTADPGWCTANSDCWCASEGATCDTTSHHCSTTGYDGLDGGTD